jgi:hypothetical protein
MSTDTLQRSRATSAGGSAFEPGDLIPFHGVTWTVSGSIEITADSSVWHEYLLVRDEGSADGERAWVSIETVDGTPRWSTWGRRRAVDINVSHEHAHDSLFAETDRGHARYRVRGDVGDLHIPAEGTLTYIDYDRPGQRVSLERFDSDEAAGGWWLSVCDLP